MSYETREDLASDDYWPMIAGKTAALLQACSEIGALLAGASDSIRASCRAFGHYLGLAFQVQDDILGIWGDETQTGKSAASDLLEGKKSLPVLYGLQKRGRFWQRWQKGPITQDEVVEVAAILREEGAYDYAQSQAAELTDKALAALQAASLHGEAGQALHRLARQLLNRQQ
jgi:geranylgeranyl diphosphate synthase type I